MASGKFTVDTHLFRELGELLVGRDSTALVELIKNAYDADAEEVTIHGQDLDDQTSGSIAIRDSGAGMTRDQFERGFLRVASRLKDEGDRRSKRFKRRYTGAKGIGRLAAHKLARQVEVYSIPDPTLTDQNAPGVDATIDWDEIERCTTFDEIESSGAISVDDVGRSKKATPGTTITLRRLRRKWTPAERSRFFAEVQTFNPPAELVEPPELVLKEDDKLLFKRARLADANARDPGFKVNLTGDFETGDEYWPTLLQAAHWVVEIDASRGERRVKYNIMPTKLGRKTFPAARTRRFAEPRNESPQGPFFQARILIREGASPKIERAWLGRSSGIRVYMEGFRVLPYGEPKDDWLSIDSDYKKRQKTLPHLSGLQFAGDATDEQEGLVSLGNSAYFGAVFLTAADAPGLRMLVNREGFVPEGGYDELVKVVRTAVNLATRVRAASRVAERDKRREERRENAASSVEPSRLDLRQAVEVSVRRASELATEARKVAATGDFATAKDLIERAAAEYSVSSDTSQRLMTEGAILRVLASVGTQMAAFVHEIHGLLGSAQAVERAVEMLRDDPDLPAAGRKKLAQLLRAIGDLRRAVERQAIYLTDVVSPDARRRRSRQRLADRFDAGKRLVEAAAERREIVIDNGIPEDLRSPPMFPAELTLVFSNLLTNAVKAAHADGRVRATAVSSDGGVVVRVENTGKAVNPDTGEKWFRPFESTTTETDPVLGQGMGMGLPITRNILEEYGASIQFVRPSKGYATALEIRFPG
jgi:signal transduction histidine kinase